MTDTQRNQITIMRTQGVGYTAIAIEVGLSKDSVKAFCRTHNLGGVKDSHKVGIAVGKKCLCCGKKIIQPEKRKEKKFCSDSCRMKWWNSHPELVKRKKLTHIICECCGVEFDSKNPKQRFCSRLCYADARKKEKDNGKRQCFTLPNHNDGSS